MHPLDAINNPQICGSPDNVSGYGESYSFTVRVKVWELEKAGKERKND